MRWAAPDDGEDIAPLGTSSPREADGRQCARTAGSCHRSFKSSLGLRVGGVGRARRGERILWWESGNRGSGGPLSAVIRLAGPVGVGGHEHLGRGHPNLRAARLQETRLSWREGDTRLPRVWPCGLPTNLWTLGASHHPISPPQTCNLWCPEYPGRFHPGEPRLNLTARTQLLALCQQDLGIRSFFFFDPPTPKNPSSRNPTSGSCS